MPNINDYTEEEIKEKARELKKTLDKYGLVAEFVAPRLWMDERTVDGGFMSTSEKDREYAMWRAYRSIDIANELGCDMIVLWLARGKLMTVHLNDQNGIKYDQDKSFGVENLRAAFNQVKVLKENGYGDHGEFVGLDVKAMRTTKDEDSYKHLENSLKVFKALEAKVDKFDYALQKELVEKRDFEGLEMYVMNLLMGVE